MMWTRVATVLLLAAGLTAGVALADQSVNTGSPFSGAIVAETSPAPPGSAQPYMAIDRMGQVYLSWLEPREGGGHRFRFSTLLGPTWSDPVTIAEGDNFLANWADVPAIHVGSDTIAASWLERGPGRGAYGIRVRTSTDGGETWTPPVTPHRDDTASEHGFVSFFELPGAGPGLGLVWLDGRATTERTEAGRGSMALRAATLSGGSPGAEMEIDSRVCDCCQTAAARIDGGVIVVYRDRSDEEVRDISASRFLNGSWSEPATVHPDNWQINACPVNGPVVASSGRSVAVAWFTVADDEPKTKIAFSTNAGETFSAPWALGQDISYGRMGIAMLDDNSVLVSSVERNESGANIVVREVERNGRMSAVVTVAPTSLERTSGLPRIVVIGRRQVVFAWTHLQDDGTTQVKVATARLK